MTTYISKDQGNFGFLIHDPFKCNLFIWCKAEFPAIVTQIILTDTDLLLKKDFFVWKLINFSQKAQNGSIYLECKSFEAL